ncbi:Phenolphthiocerol synthesis polyketide synthase type I Pks15/1 [Planctomycetes bacterium CA13]|uniref:Phenolphthiocerol synthesis polyketide synthase type I Pks15/1 n=1 Tax=Novipirellula herctigrandis TaxID=2527986 RepID=A0A5C5YVW3_9BACT|nr:Phenolphthiocerol synthesis polyketide synthase type I Pks15/1 [Planctomycetes bacterium CA13]
MSTQDFDAQAEPIVVIGRGCRLPGASGLDAYWDLILSGGCTQTKLPDDRLDRDLLFSPEKGKQNKTYADIGCLVDLPNLRTSDCRLPYGLKTHPETTYATLASVAFDTVDDAGLDPLDLPHDNVGVFIGHTRASSLAGDIAFANYIGQAASLLDQVCGESKLPLRGLSSDRLKQLKQDLVDQVRRDYPNQSSHPLGASCSARAVSDALRVTGPTMSFNAACASSTHALIQAVRSLQTGRIDMAIAGGASYCHSDSLVLFSKAQSLSASRTRPWDSEADGLVIGEGYVTLLLCRQSTARRLGCQVHGVIRGLGLSSDGKGKSLWAPRKEGQVLAIGRAYRGDLQRSDVGYIEAHATSTQVGDATEISALAESYQCELPPGIRIPIGSVKANIGHTLETAGIAGLLKCMLAMERETIPPVTHVATRNPKIDWDNIPFELPAESRPWKANNQGWLAGVNAFGIGGLNTHVVVQRPLKDGRGVEKASAPIEPRREAIAVIGVGCILPGPSDANGMAAFWKRLMEHASAIVPLPKDRWNGDAYPTSPSPSGFDVRSRLGGVVQDYQYDWRRHRVPPKQIANASPLQFMILDAVDEACHDAGITWTDSLRQSCGVLTGTTFGGEFANQLQMGLRLPELKKRIGGLLEDEGLSAPQQQEFLDRFAEVLLKEMPALLDETGSFTSSSLASRITKSLNLMGGAAAVDSGHGSSGAAILCCVDQLVCGDNDLMICIGAQQDLGPSRYVGMTRAGILGDQDGTDGIFPGEGCVVLILERERDAIKNGHPIRAVIQDIAAGYVTKSPQASLALTMERLVAEHPEQKVAVDHVEFANSTHASLHAEASAAVRWSLRDHNRSVPAAEHDASQLVGHLAGGSMAVSALASMPEKVSSNQSPDKPRDFCAGSKRIIIGGGIDDPSFQVLLRDQ